MYSLAVQGDCVIASLSASVLN